MSFISYAFFSASMRFRRVNVCIYEYALLACMLFFIVFHMAANIFIACRRFFFLSRVLLFSLFVLFLELFHDYQCIAVNSYTFHFIAGLLQNVNFPLDFVCVCVFFFICSIHLEANSISSITFKFEIMIFTMR